MTRKEKAEAKRIDKMIEQVYSANCSGIQIDVMDINKLFAEGRRAFHAGEDLAPAIVSFVQKIRKN